MIKYIITLLVSLLELRGANLETAIQDVRAIKVEMDSLKEEDISDDYRLRQENEDTDKLYVRTFYRGSRKIMHIVWGKDWIGNREKMYSGTMFDGEVPICRFVHLSGNKTDILPVKKPASEYEIWVGIGDSGGGTVDILKDGRLFESYIIEGRSSRPVDGLAYVKNLMGVEGAKGIVNAIKDMRPEKKDKTNK